jgi:hypothetical protein
MNRGDGGELDMVEGGGFYNFVPNCQNFGGTYSTKKEDTEDISRSLPT